MSYRYRRFAPVSVAVLIAVTTATAAAPRVTFTDTKLKNGLRVIIVGRSQRAGVLGRRHLQRRLARRAQGPHRLRAPVRAHDVQGLGEGRPGEHFTLIFNNGGNMNGTTNKDRTLYYETLPANQLDLALFLEADRMWSLDITKDNLDNQRNAVQEERRLGVDNQPYGKTFEAIDELAYENFAYEHSVIGSMADLNAADVDDVAAFFKTYYAPNNAVALDRRRRQDRRRASRRSRKYFERDSVAAGAARRWT